MEIKADSFSATKFGKEFKHNLKDALIKVSINERKYMDSDALFEALN
jgi:hypothetical protein